MISEKTAFTIFIMIVIGLILIGVIGFI